MQIFSLTDHASSFLHWTFVNGYLTTCDNIKKQVLTSDNWNSKGIEFFRGKEFSIWKEIVFFKVNLPFFFF